MIRGAKKNLFPGPRSSARSGEMSKRRKFDIIAGAIRDDVDEVAGAVDIDGVSINYQDPVTGLSALHRAAARGNTNVLNWLVARSNNDLDIFAQDARGKTAADLAGEIGQDVSLTILLPIMYPDDHS